MKNLLIGVVALLAATLLGGCVRHGCGMNHGMHSCGGDKPCCEGKCDCSEKCGEHCKDNKGGTCGGASGTCGSPEAQPKTAGGSCGGMK